MPEILDRCVQHVMDQGHDESAAQAMCRSSLGLMSDGSEDKKKLPIGDDEMRSRLAVAMQFRNGPSLVKEMLVARPIGKFKNGPQEGDLTKEYLANLVRRFSDHPRQVPIFMEEEHPPANDQAMPVGWVEALRQDKDGNLHARVKLHGPGAQAVGGDLIRGASIYTVNAKTYDGKPIGAVLKHLLLTNEGYIKDLNVAASRYTGGETVAHFFTALKPREANMAEENKTENNGSPPEPEEMALKVKTLEALVVEKTEENLELTAKVKNLEADVERFKANPQLDQAMVQLKSQDRQLRAEKIRRLVKKGSDAGQFSYEQTKGYDHDSDEGVLTWFKSSMFKDSFDKLEFALATFPKKVIGRSYASGTPMESDEIAISPDDKKRLPKGYTEAELAIAAKAQNSEDYMRLRTEKGLS